ncbi:DNA circularization protein [Jeongeupia naejangsanensis]|uniref:DNA circularization N-terminal domain-containing protein n=1 Tax=Jeongeupia naejangsanensis TaxID=613195 RepID=A0ABS2BJ31_9NEIS|nr:DNA circularization N-terminal domain-containing protein [Jeongeupia naejangsanensis]MBM3114996.1 DNA circularization N-terminal domain-containing protein [Jeongeupia naejangsanensis]
MAWRKQLQKAQFRDVFFHVSSSTAEVGRRVQLTEYPLRDTPYAEDLGRKARTFSLSAFVIGPDYMAKRDALIKAFETPGPGTLQLPHAGTIQVVVTKVSVEESSDQGGMARFSLEFAEFGANDWPSSKVDTDATLNNTCDQVLASASMDFTLRWNTLSLSIQASFQSAALDDLTALAKSGLAFIDMVTGEVRDAKAQLDRILNPIQALVRLPGELFARLNESVTRIEDQVKRTLDPRQIAASLAPLIYQFAPNLPFVFPTLIIITPQPGPTPTPGTQPLPPGVVPVPAPTQANRPVIRPTTPANIALINSAKAQDIAIRTIATVQLARSIVTVPLIASADLIALRDDALAAIDTLLEPASDQGYRDLLALKRATMAATAQRLTQAVPIVTITPRSRTPALVLAWRQTGAIAAETDLVRRNGVRHPGFVPANRPIQLPKE